MECDKAPVLSERADNRVRLIDSDNILEEMHMLGV